MMNPPSYIHVHIPKPDLYSAIGYHQREGDVCIYCDVCKKGWYVKEYVANFPKSSVISSMLRHWRKVHNYE